MNKRNIQTLDSIKSSYTKLLWCSSKYDGIPNCGLMLYNGSKCWYRLYDIDVEEKRYSDYDFIQKGYRQEQLEFIDEEDRIWDDERFYFKIYKLSKKDLLNIEYEHEKNIIKYGNHTDYELKNKKRNNTLDSLLDSLLIRNYKKFKNLLIKKRPNVSNKSFNDNSIIYENDVIGYFRI